MSIMLTNDLGLYFHIPFCRRRCGYCDFFSTEGKQKFLPEYMRMLIREVKMIGAAGEKSRAGSVYFGGGTPSLIDPPQIANLIEEIRRSFRLSPDAEISLEANPGTVDCDRLALYRKAGINRLSLGVQSADNCELRMLERIHTFSGAVQAFHEARRAGFTNVSLDLIYGLPGQTVPLWERTLDRALSLSPNHLSLYALTLERGTRLARAVRRGALPAPEEDAAADMYELAEEKLAAAGYRHYEISNWAKDGDMKTEYEIIGSTGACKSRFPKFACTHNLRYWLNLPYLGLGAGAHGCAAGRRYANVCSVEKYIERMRTERTRRFPLSPAATRSHIRTRDEDMRETIWLGLRLTEAGVDREEYRRRFGEDYYARFKKEIDSSVTDGLVEWTGEQAALRLSPHGRLLGNRVFQLFV
ncbi:MAG: radical SAM family heme chaperone HemW [Anaerolineales bacterium]